MSKSMFRNALDRYKANREKQARGYVYSYLLTQDDKTLKSLGLNREELKRGAYGPFPF